MRLAAAYLSAAAVLASLDLLWLGVAARDLYRRNLGHLMADQVRWPAAVVFYIVYTAGVFYFAVLPALERGSLQKAAVSGALLGFLVYAVYDLTNLAVLRGWPAGLSAIDVAWGTLLTAAVASAGFAVARS